MNRTLTAAVALAMGLGMIGLAQAQTSNYVTPGKFDPAAQVESPALPPSNYVTPGKPDFAQQSPAP